MFGSSFGGLKPKKNEEEKISRPGSTNTTQAQKIQEAQKSRPRPIHIPPRQPLNETPDETEPSFSYEERSFLAHGDEEDAIDAFHRRLGHLGGRKGGGFGSGLKSHHNRHSDRGSSVEIPMESEKSGSQSLLRSSLEKQETSGNNFWRTTSRQPTSNQRPAGSSYANPSPNREYSDGSGKKTTKGRNGMVRRRGRLRSSGQTTKQNNDNHRNYTSYEEDYDDDIYTRRGKSKQKGQRQQSGGALSAQKNLGRETSNNFIANNSKGRQFPHSNSTSSLGSTGSIHNGEARMKSKQRDAVRRLKLDAQQQLSEDGGIVDNGYYHEVPTMDVDITQDNQINKTGRTYGPRGDTSRMSALEEEMSNDNCTTDGSIDDHVNLTRMIGSHPHVQNNLEMKFYQANSGISLQQAATTRVPHDHKLQHERSKKLASAAGAAAVALSEYHLKNSLVKKNGTTGDGAPSSLTHHIYNEVSSSSQQQTPLNSKPTPDALVGVRLHVQDNTDNRSTTSTMSDLSMNDSNTGHRHPNTSSNSSSNFIHGALGAPNSIGRNIPGYHQQIPPNQQQYRPHSNLLNHQRVLNIPPGSAGDAPGLLDSAHDELPRTSGSSGIFHSQPFNTLVGTEHSLDQGFVRTESAISSHRTSLTGSSSSFHGAEMNRHSFGRISESDNSDRRTMTEKSQLQNKIAMRLDACETIRFPFKKKLMLNSLHMTAADIPVKDLYGTLLGQSLHKLSLSGNRLSTIPKRLATCLPTLKSLDISQCELHQLPDRWNLPQLRRLNLSHNRLTDFPEETMLEGLLELQELNMFGNKVSMIVIPHSPKLLVKLEILNLGYNDLAQLPEELDRLKSLRVLKVMNNFLEKIPMRVCNMELKTIDVSNNPVIQPPIETCERGIGSMKRYYHCLSIEEQSKPNALEALQTKAARHSIKQAKLKMSGGGLKMHFQKPKRRAQVSLGRRQSDESSQSSHSKSKSQKSIPSLSNQDRVTTTVESRPSLTESEKSESRMTFTESSPPSVISKASTMRGTPSNVPLPPPQVSSPRASLETSGSNFSMDDDIDTDHVTINETLKVIFVGMAMAGKTSMIKRLIEGEDAVIPKRDERTIGVDIYEWDPTIDRRYEHIDNRILLQDTELEGLCPNANVKFSVWDFAGQHVYHATHELFFSPRALYVLVWDMGAKNTDTRQRVKVVDDSLQSERGTFKLGYDSDDESDSEKDDFICEEESRRADRALERDIDEKVQFWVDCIQSSVPGAAILPVATFADHFEEDDYFEAKRRCKILKQRLEKHEERRIQGIKDRLKEYVDQNRANDAPALRLRKLLGSYTRPKIIFGDDESDSVVMVSGTKYTGFAELTEKINNIATGRDTAKYKYPIFRGHVGARIPRMRLKVLEAVRRMRDRFKVVEWGYFLQELRNDGIVDVENVSDALHYLTNIGELSYFGDVLPDLTQKSPMVRSQGYNANVSTYSNDEIATLTDDDDDDVNEKKTLDVHSNSETRPTMSLTDDGTLSTHENQIAGGLSQFVFLNPRWLVAAVACILRHDLEREIQETRRSLSVEQKLKSTMRSDTFYEANMNCPVITSEDACMLWQAKKFTRKAARRAEEFSAGIKLKPFEFLQLLLVRFRVFIPIDLGIDKAFLGGKEYSRKVRSSDQSPRTPEVITLQNDLSLVGENDTDLLRSTYFFLPSLLGPGEPTEAWTYKSTDSWKATLCHSILFPDGVPPGLMERITASVLSNLYAMAYQQDRNSVEPWRNTTAKGKPDRLSYDGNINVKEILCWRNAFLVKLGMQVESSAVEVKESIVEIFTALVDKDSSDCVGSDQMAVGSRRLVTSGKGQEGDGGRKIWMGGYLAVVKAVTEVMDEYGGLEFEKQGFCPECLMKKSVSEAHCWDAGLVEAKVIKGDATIRCRHGHKVDIRLVSPMTNNMNIKTDAMKGRVAFETEASVPINDILRSVVVVGLWDGKTRKILRVGSGFIADRKRGLIVTASHTLMNIWGDRDTPFGENYYGMPQAKVVIGVIPRRKGGEEPGTEAVFRYFAKIVAKDPEIEKGTCHLDACVLCITTRMENDVGGNGEGCGDQIEHILLNNPVALKQEKLQHLKITDKYELDEPVRIIGYNQGGEGLMGPGVSLNRYVDFARGYVCKMFAGGSGDKNDHRFKPRKEIVAICPTIGGHSGGPCVNQQGEVIGILSRADPAENQRCYLVPTVEWGPLLKMAKKSL